MDTFVVSAAHEGQRLDFVLKTLGIESGLRGCRRLCEAGLVRLNGRIATAAQKARAGDLLEVYSNDLLEAGGQRDGIYSLQPMAVARRAAHLSEGAASVGLCPPTFDAASERTNGAASERTNGAARDLAYQVPELAADFGTLIFVHKPAGLHSAALAGKSGQPSLEALLPQVTPRPGFKLLTRLDQPTSGLIAAANDHNMARIWREAETAGDCLKFYCALLEGELDHEMVLQNALDTDKRLKTRVLDRRDPDFTRHTKFYPLARLEAEDILCFSALSGMEDILGFGVSSGAENGLKGGEIPSGIEAPVSEGGVPAGVFTLAGCLIRRGARHQIRAHAAHGGYPLAGDSLYGASTTMPLMLHHGRIITPFGEARRGAPWEAGFSEDVRMALAKFWNI